jgi:SAM-dependent methyltransferase
MSPFYAEDLAFIHHTGFAGFAQEAAPGVLALLQGADIRRGLVVDLGCGSGLWARALLEAGFEVLGVDIAPAMIELARGVAPAARYLVSSFYEVDLPSCVAVTVLGEGFTYMAAQDPREALPVFLPRVYAALAPGGVLLFDMILRSEREPMRYRTMREGVDWRVDAEVIEEPELSLLTRHITARRQVEGTERITQETHRVRTFSASELERMLQACGFEVEVHRRYGAMPLPPQRLAFLARKPKA